LVVVVLIGSSDIDMGRYVVQTEHRTLSIYQGGPPCPVYSWRSM
jgi:hypothetical protein